MCFNRQHHVLLNSKLGRKLFVLPPRGSPQYLDPGSCLISNSISWGLALLSMFQLNLLWLLPWAHVKKPFPGEVFFQGLRCNISDSSLEVCFRLPGNVVGSSPWTPSRSCLGAGLGTCTGNRGWARGTQRALPASAVIPCWTLQRAFYSQSFWGCAPTSASVAAVCHPCSLQSSCSAVMLVFQAWPQSRDPWLSVPPVCKYSGAGCLNVSAVCGMSWPVCRKSGCQTCWGLELTQGFLFCLEMGSVKLLRYVALLIQRFTILLGTGILWCWTQLPFQLQSP